MPKISISSLGSGITDLITSILSGVMFYTIIPLPSTWTGNWSRIARWSPVVGLLLGGILTGWDWLLEIVGVPNLTTSALITAVWVILTGGLHLDGAMDTADGLAVTEPQRRLEVMKDSTTGAFGAIAAVIILLVKTAALSEISLPLGLVILSAMGWARWGQVWAIAFYPYLRETGKGAFHQENLRLPQDIWFGLIALLAVSGFWFILTALSWWSILILVLGNIAIALITGYWFNRQLGGHTGDTYGAVVEWSEVLILCWLTIFGR